MNAAFDKAFDRLMEKETTRYTNDRDDSGGATKYGVTEAVARANGYQGKIADMPISFARNVYFRQYWALLHLDHVAGESAVIAEELFDTAVNLGPSFSGKSLQRVLNVLNRNERDYHDVRVDGLIGPMTLAALRRFLQVRRGQGGEAVLLKVLNALQGARYVEIASARKKDEKYTFGWFSKRL